MFHQRVSESFPVFKSGLGLGLGLGIAATLLAPRIAAYLCNRSNSCVEELPGPSLRKQNEDKLDKMHDRAVESSMAASDPPSSSMPEVRQ